MFDRNKEFKFEEVVVALWAAALDRVLMADVQSMHPVLRRDTSSEVQPPHADSKITPTAVNRSHSTYTGIVGEYRRRIGCGTIWLGATNDR